VATKNKSSKAKKFTLAPEHLTALSAVPSSDTSVDFFGRVIETSVSGLPDLHQLSEIFGYRDQGRCVRFPMTQRISLPAPDGPADGCGWDPSLFVVWRNLPRSLSTKQLNVTTTTVHEVMSAAVFKSAVEAEPTVDDVLHDWLIQSVTGQPIPDIDQLQVAWASFGSGGAFTPQVQQNLANLLNKAFQLSPPIVVANLPGTLTVGQLKLNLHRSA
jgi:hypothetical protein